MPHRTTQPCAGKGVTDGPPEPKSNTLRSPTSSLGQEAACFRINRTEAARSTRRRGPTGSRAVTDEEPSNHHRRPGGEGEDKLQTPGARNEAVAGGGGGGKHDWPWTHLAWMMVAPG